VADALVDPTFQPLGREHFALLTRWLAEPLVAYWWNHETTLEALERDFGPAIDGAEPTEMFLALMGGGPFGLIQRYRIDAYPEYVQELAPVLPLPEGALSIDYLIGEPHLRGMRFGTSMIRRFLALTWQAHPAAPSVIVPVNVNNVASWRALEGAGLRRVALGRLKPDNPAETWDHYVYLCEAPAVT
jgi:aminoglycoside 6'-N-acetyltransferase